MTPADPAWSEKLAVDDVPEEGLHLEIAADEAARLSIARMAVLRDLPKLEAVFDIERRGPHSLRVTGTVFATVVQDCVVTLEPFENEVREDIDLVFSQRAERPICDEEGKATVHLGETDPPEQMHGGVVDLGAIATEFFMLGVDPYPRKEGAVFDAPAQSEDPATHPFAALAALKKGDKGDRN